MTLQQFVPSGAVARQPRADCRQPGQSFGRARAQEPEAVSFTGRRPSALPKSPHGWNPSGSWGRQLSCQRDSSHGGVCMGGKYLAQPGEGLQMWWGS